MSDEIYNSDPRAKSLEGFIAALEILAKHESEGLQTKYSLDAQHDIIYAGPSINDIPEDSQDGILLQALGWHANEDEECWAYFT